MSDNKKPTDFRARWDDLRRECEALENDNSRTGLPHDDPRVIEHEAQIAANNTLRWEAAEAAWATPARDLPDLLLLAEIAYDQFFDLRAFPALPAEDGDNHQKIAVACLIRGIADVARAQAPPCPADAAAADAHAAGTARLLAAWRAAVPPEIAALEASNDIPPDAEVERTYQNALGRMRDSAAEAWGRPVAAWGDVRLRAEIVHHALYADYYGDGSRRFEAVLAGKQPAEDQLTLGTFDERAVAELVKAILWAGEAGPAAAKPPA